MSYAKQRKLDTFLKTAENKSSNKSDGSGEGEGQVLITFTEPKSTSSSNISEESNAEIDDDSRTLASSSDTCHSPVTSLPQKSLIALKSNNSFEDKSIQLLPGWSGKRKRIVCKVCLPNPEIVKRACYRGRLPPICQPEGTESREQTIREHLQSSAHQECLKAERSKKLSNVQKSQSVPLMKMVNSQRQQLANKIGSLIIHVYNDAKCLTSSAFSWPSRVIAAKMAHDFDCNKSFESYSASNFDLQYIRPAFVQELLRTIVSADLPRIKEEIDSCIAASFRCDASMDQTQKDNEYMLLNTINKDGKQDLKFQALKMGASDTVGFDKVLKVVNHVSTDGEAKNTGQFNGLWKLLDDEREKLDVNFPLLKSICAVHSTANAYKDLCKSVPEIEHWVKKLSGIATFFHASAKRTSDLEKVGAKENLTVHRIPKYFEVRWSEFTAALLDAVLCSWQALVKFCEEQHGTEEKIFLKLLTNKDNILMMCFVADLLFLLKVFQKKLQRDSLTIVDIEPEAEKFQKSIDKLSTSPLLGGWEEAFKERFNEEENTFC